MTAPTITLEIPENHPSFPGHFPGQPILPGVLLLQRVMSFAEATLQRPIERYSIHNAKFLAPVLPKDCVRITLDLVSEGEFKFALHVTSHSSGVETLALSGLLRHASVQINIS
jgi:3-hydroxyacyl-[acyl-carrier-protein] dehydratase